MFCMIIIVDRISHPFLRGQNSKCVSKKMLYKVLSYFILRNFSSPWQLMSFSSIAFSVLSIMSSFVPAAMGTIYIIEVFLGVFSSCTNAIEIH